MKTPWPPVIAAIAAVLLQIAIAPNMAVGGVVPNFLLLVVVTLALTEGPNAGCAVGFGAGVLLDLLGEGPLGLWALVLCVAGYTAGMLEANMFAHGWLLPVTVVFLAGLASEVAYGVVLAVVGEGGGLAGSFLHVMLPGAFYNTVLAVLVYPWLARLLRQEPTVHVMRQLR